MVVQAESRLKIAAIGFVAGVLESQNFRNFIKKGIRIYLGYWERALYFFLGVQVFTTALVVFLNKMMP